MDRVAPIAYSPPAFGTRSGREGLSPTGNIDALVRLFHAYAQGDSGRGGDRLASADAARRHGAAGERRYLFLAAAGVRRPEANRADRARGAGPRRLPGSADADHPVGRAVEEIRPLRRLR